MATALTVGQKTTWSNWKRHSRHSRPSNCGSNLHLVYNKAITAKPFYVKKSSLYQETVSSDIVLFRFFLPQRLTLLKVNSFRKTKIVNWHKAVNVGHVIFNCLCLMYLFIMCSLLSLSNVKSSLSSVSRASFGSFL